LKWAQFPLGSPGANLGSSLPVEGLSRGRITAYSPANRKETSKSQKLAPDFSFRGFPSFRQEKGEKMGHGAYVPWVGPECHVEENIDAMLI
jgi:hypothetical protein